MSKFDQFYTITARELGGLIASIVLLGLFWNSQHFVAVLVFLFAFMFLRWIFESMIGAIIQAYMSKKSEVKDV